MDVSCRPFPFHKSHVYATQETMVGSSFQLYGASGQGMGAFKCTQQIMFCLPRRTALNQAVRVKSSTLLLLDMLRSKYNFPC